MALAAVKTDTPATLANRIAEAQRAEVRPRNRVAELQATFDQALTAKDYAAADKLQGELQAAREALVMAEGLTRGLREGAALAEEQRAAEQQAIGRARDQDEGRRLVGEALAAEQQARDAIEESLAQLWATIGAAQDAFRQAQAWEEKAGAAMRRVWEGKVRAGEVAGMPNRIPAPNDASVLAGSVPLIRELMKWGGPERRTPRPVIAAPPLGASAGGLTQQSPWQ